MDRSNGKFTRSVLILICALFSSSSSHRWTSSEFPDPQNDYVACGLKYKGFVCDPDGVLTPRDRSKLNDLIEEFHEAAMGTCIKERCGECSEYPGIFLGVAVAYKIYEYEQVREIDDNNDGIIDRTEVTNDPPYDWAREVAVRQWDWQNRLVNKEKSCSNTVVIFLYAYDERAYMAGGSEVRYTSEFHSIIRQTSHLLWNNYGQDDAYYKGLKAMIRAYWGRLRVHHFEGGDDYKFHRTIVIVILSIIGVGTLACLVYAFYLYRNQ